MGSCRLTFLREGTKVDVTVPDDLALAFVVGEVLELSGGAGGDAERHLAPAWGLAQPGRGRLSLELTAREAGLDDGDLVVLDAEESLAGDAPVIVEDVADAVAQAFQSRDRWSDAERRRLLLVAGAVLVGTAPFALVVDGLAVDDGGIAVVVAVFGLMLLVNLERGRAWRVAQVLAAGLLSWWAVGAAGLVSGDDRAVAELVGAGLAGAGAGALVIGTAVTSTSVAMSAVAVATLLGAAIVGAPPRFDLDRTPVAAAVALVSLGVLAVAPTLALRAARLTSVREGTDRIEVVAERVGIGASVLACCQAAGAVGIAAAAIAFALDESVFGVLLAAVLAAEVALKARGYRDPAEVVPLGLAAMVSVVAVAIGIARLGGAEPAAAVLAAGGVGVLLVAGRGAAASPLASRRLDRVEAVLNIALVPLALGALGVFALVADLLG